MELFHFLGDGSPFPNDFGDPGLLSSVLFLQRKNTTYRLWPSSPGCQSDVLREELDRLEKEFSGPTTVVLPVLH